MNTVVGWMAVGAILFVAVWSLTAGNPLWGGFALVLAITASIPSLWTRDPTAVLPWPLSVTAAVAGLAGVGSPYTEVAGYLAVATAANLVVTELDRFTRVEFGRRFAFLFAVLTTMAVQALWIVAQFFADQWLGTDFLTTQIELQWDIVAATVVGFLLGGFSYWCFSRFGFDGNAKCDADAGER